MRFRFFPIALIVVGVTLLLGKLGIVPMDDIRLFFHAWWPLLLVGLGTAMLVLPRGACRHSRCAARREGPPAAAGPT